MTFLEFLPQKSAVLAQEKLQSEYRSDGAPFVYCRIQTNHPQAISICSAFEYAISCITLCILRITFRLIHNHWHSRMDVGGVRTSCETFVINSSFDFRYRLFFYRAFTVESTRRLILFCPISLTFNWNGIRLSYRSSAIKCSSSKYDSLYLLISSH